MPQLRAPPLLRVDTGPSAKHGGGYRTNGFTLVVTYAVHASDTLGLVLRVFAGFPSASVSMLALGAELAVECQPLLQPTLELQLLGWIEELTRCGVVRRLIAGVELFDKDRYKRFPVAI